MTEYFVILTVRNDNGQRTFAGPLSARTRKTLFFQALTNLGAGPDYTVVFFSAEPNDLGSAS